jgi:ABC-type phosphate transport system substrate-binding protein
MRHAFLRPIVVAFALAMAACGGDTTTTTPTTTTPTPELFEGQLTSRGASQFFSFTVTTAGNVNLTLASVTTAATPGTSLNLPLGVGLGTPVGTDCNLTQQTTTGPGLVPQVTGSNVATGTYCVKVFDVGNLTVPVNFAVRIEHT